MRVGLTIFAEIKKQVSEAWKIEFHYQIEIKFQPITHYKIDDDTQRPRSLENKRNRSVFYSKVKKKEILKAEIWKSNVDIGHPCLIAVFTPKLDSLFPTLYWKMLWKLLMARMIFSTCPEFAPQTLSVDSVESLFKIHVVDGQLPLPFSALFNDVTQSEVLVRAPSSFSKTCLLLSNSNWSTASQIRLMMNLARILLGTDRRVTVVTVVQGSFLQNLYDDTLRLIVR